MPIDQLIILILTLATTLTPAVAQLIQAIDALLRRTDLTPEQRAKLVAARDAAHAALQSTP